MFPPLLCENAKMIQTRLACGPPCENLSDESRGSLDELIHVFSDPGLMKSIRNSWGNTMEGIWDADCAPLKFEQKGSCLSL